MFARVSANSFPGMPVCAGTQCIVIEVCDEMVRRALSVVSTVLERIIVAVRARIDDWLSVQICISGVM